ncbi:chorismate--pyruvate lyase family protein [Bordetella sp. 2513F-2]
MILSSPVSPSGWAARAPASLPLLHRAWLFRPGALTAGLRGLGQVRLRVLAEYPSGAPEDEARPMGLPARHPVWVREVLMSVDGVDSVAARSLTPLAASHGVWQGMRRLMTRPLADMLYHDRSVRRSPFAVLRLAPPVPFHRMVSRLPGQTPASATGAWARRSVFWRHGQPLLVAECFLPDFWHKVVADRPNPPLVPHRRSNDRPAS